jgi:DNA mismatch repair protein MutH
VYRYAISTSHFIDLTIGRQAGRRTRYTFRLTETELVADPINSELNSLKTSTIYCVADVGVLGVGTNWTKMGTLLGALLLQKADGATALSRLIAGET